MGALPCSAGTFHRSNRIFKINKIKAISGTLFYLVNLANLENPVKGFLLTTAGYARRIRSQPGRKFRPVLPSLTEG
jgi:hypothetical protein